MINLTVGITAYREGLFLKEAIQSLLNQSIQNWKVVIVLDGGADKLTRKIFNKFEYKNLKKFYFDKNQGPYITRNKAIELTDTKWYFHLDGDDKLPIKSLEHINDKINSNNECEYIFGDALYFDKNKSFVREPYSEPEILCQKPLFVGQSPITIDLYKKMGGYTNKLINNNDWDFWISVYEKEIIGAQIDQIIYERRIRSNSVGSIYAKDKVSNVKKIISRHPKFFNKKDRSKIALFKVHELKARTYKANGNREMAFKHAKKALKYGEINNSIKAVFKENNLNYFHFKVRRLNNFLRKLIAS